MVLFIIFTNGLGGGADCTPHKLTDDTKLRGVGDMPEDCGLMKQGLQPVLVGSIPSQDETRWFLRSLPIQAYL